MKFKSALLHCLKVAGVFAMCRRATRRKLRILCYHGFSIGDQHEYNPILFMRPDTFERRMQTLHRLGYPVIGLDEAVARLAADRIDGCETVITIDDGWRTTRSLAAAIMQQLSYPATIYVTTYHSERQTDVFNVALNYLLWRAEVTSLAVEGFHPRIDGRYETGSDFREIADALTKLADAHLDGAGRQELLEYIVRKLGVCAPADLTDGRFRLMSPAEVTAVAKAGFDIQLHTHRHQLSMSDRTQVQREIEDNRTRLEAWTGLATRHFCYPSGRYSGEHADWLKALGVASATTCDPGLNDSRTNPYTLRRFLDSEAVSDIQFEAELAGVGSLLRQLRSQLGFARAG